MMKINYLIFPFIIISCLGDIKSNNNDYEIKTLFEQYLFAFKRQDLPFMMDRKAVFEMMNNADSFFEIKDSLKTFIPAELLKNYPNCIFRSLYILPEYNEIILVLILQDFKDEYDMRVVKNHLVTYNSNGVILDCQELAGVVIDAWEAYFDISDEFTLDRKLYQRRINSNIEENKYSYLVETCYEYHINHVGLILETNRTTRGGYFEGDWTGYNFVKP